MRMGTLYIVSTPIGNLKDITLRAIEVLKKVDYVLCEDTRVTGKLLKAYEIDKRMESFNEFTEDRKTGQVILDLKKGSKIALVSDAGTPLVSDPGFKLVREAGNQGIKVESIPGATAAIAALSVSGLPPDKFLFVGYLPKKEGKRKEILKKVKAIKESLPSTVIFYESPFRVLKLLGEIKEVLGDVDVVICRELTKLHEEVRREKISQTSLHFSQSTPRGEFVVLI